jgi:hypothetical protein
MTAVTMSPPRPVRFAAHQSVCGVPGCHRLIERGQLITKPQCGAWRHVDCANPYQGRAGSRR